MAGAAMSRGFPHRLFAEMGNPFCPVRTETRKSGI